MLRFSGQNPGSNITMDSNTIIIVKQKVPLDDKAFLWNFLAMTLWSIVCNYKCKRMSLYCKFESYSAWPGRNRKPDFSESSMWCCWCHHTANVSAGTRRTKQKIPAQFWAHHNSQTERFPLWLTWVTDEHWGSLKATPQTLCYKEFPATSKTFTLKAKPPVWSDTIPADTDDMLHEPYVNINALTESLCKVFFLNVSTCCRDVLHLFSSVSLIFSCPHT